jgi:hypothetical protein
MTGGEFEEMRAAAAEGVLTKKEQIKLVKHCEALITQNANYYVILYDMKLEIEECLKLGQESGIDDCSTLPEPS